MMESILDEFEQELRQRDGGPISTAQAKRNRNFSRLNLISDVRRGWRRTLRGAKAGQTRRKNREFIER